jgi:protein phosphatase
VKFEIQVAAKSEVGLRRGNNEDNYGFDTRLGLFVLCDGMGGAAAGEVASRLAVQCVLNYFRQSKTASKRDSVSHGAGTVTKAIEMANTAIREVAARNIRQSGMGSTIVVALCQDARLTIGHLGDSRAYLLSRGRLKQITRDHSLVAEQMSKGFITPVEAANSALKNIVTKALGVSDKAEPDVQELAVAPDDTLLLACDGLTNFVPEDRIVSILTADGDLETAAFQLMETAKQNRSNDNITCIVARFRRSRFWSRRPPDKSEGPV